MKKISSLPAAATLVLLLTGCPTSQYNNEELWKKEIRKTDKEFSEASRRKGMKHAFIDYMDNEGVLLRPERPPLMGAAAIEYLTQTNDSAYTLTWEPSAVHVAASGDMGYSFGIYRLQVYDTIIVGTYVSIWKKQKDGKWKFVLDSGNSGIDNNQQ